MKNRMKKLTAAILALCCVPVAGLTASAEGLPHYWGETTWDAVEALEFIGQGEYLGKTVQLYVIQNAGNTQAVSVTPRMKCLRFVLRDDTDAEAEQKAFEIIETYIPGEISSYYKDAHWAKIVDAAGEEQASIEQVSDRVYDVYVRCDTGESGAAWEAGILLDLARAHLISGYYGWGETADYHVQSFRGLTHYQETMQVADDQPGQYKTIAIDWEAVQIYLDKAHPGYLVEKSLLMTVNEKDNDGNDHIHDYYEYNIKTPATLSNREELVVMCELWNQFGIFPALEEPECMAETEPLTGHNALLQPGDVTLDTDITIVDVIALNRNIMTGEPLCDTAKQNADLNGSGAPDEADSLDLLKYIVGINDSLL